MNPIQIIFFFLFFTGVVSVLTFIVVGLYGAVYNSLFISYMHKKNPKRYQEIWNYEVMGQKGNVFKW